MALFGICRGAIRSAVSRSFARKGSPWDYVEDGVEDESSEAKTKAQPKPKPLDRQYFENLFVPFCLGSTISLGTYKKVSDYELHFECNLLPERYKIIEAFKDCNREVEVSLVPNGDIRLLSPHAEAEPYVVNYVHYRKKTEDEYEPLFTEEELNDLYNNEDIKELEGRW